MSESPMTDKTVQDAAIELLSHLKLYVLDQLPDGDALRDHMYDLTAALSASPSPPPSAGVDAVAVKQWQDWYADANGQRNAAQQALSGIVAQAAMLATRRAAELRELRDKHGCDTPAGQLADHCADTAANIARDIAALAPAPTPVEGLMPAPSIPTCGPIAPIVESFDDKWLGDGDSVHVLHDTTPVEAGGEAVRAVSDNGKRWRIIPVDGDWEMVPVGHITLGQAKALCQRIEAALAKPAPAVDAVTDAMKQAGIDASPMLPMPELAGRSGRVSLTTEQVADIYRAMRIAALAPAAQAGTVAQEVSHRLCNVPGWEYETTTGQRKAWDDADTPPEGDGWERNVEEGHKGWERFEYHEESYWRRLKRATPAGGEEGR